MTVYLLLWLAKVHGRRLLLLLVLVLLLELHGKDARRGGAGARM